MKIVYQLFIAALFLLCSVTTWAAEATMEQWGAAHYENYGKIEGRTLTSSGKFEDYVRQYPDLLTAYNAGFRGTASDSASTASPFQIFLIFIYLGICYLFLFQFFFHLLF